jgi:hypothetical protein
MNKRPASVTSLLFAVLSLTAWNALRLGAAIVDWDVLAEFAPRPGPLYIFTTASFWTLGGLATWRAIRRRNHHTLLFTAFYLIGYAIWWWIDRLLLQCASPNWLFALALTILLLGLVALDLFSKKTISYFHQRETHEQTITDQNPA